MQCLSHPDEGAVEPGAVAEAGVDGPDGGKLQVAGPHVHRVAVTIQAPPQRAPLQRGHPFRSLQRGHAVVAKILPAGGELIPLHCGKLAPEEMGGGEERSKSKCVCDSGGGEG